RLRDRLAATLAALTLRPALASTLALLVVAVAAGSLWLAHIRRVNTTTEPSAASELASKSPTGNVRVTPSPAAAELEGHDLDPIENLSGDDTGSAKLTP